MRQIIGRRKFTVRDEPHEFWSSPPVECDFQLGDKVTYTNEYGVVFPGKTIIGFTWKAAKFGFIYIDSDCWWMVRKPSELTLESRSELQTLDPNVYLDGFHGFPLEWPCE